MKVLECFLSYRADTTISQNLLFLISKGNNSKNTQSGVTALALCTSSHVALHLCKISWKYLKQFSSYRADTILWQRYFLWQTARAKKYASQPYGGRHNNPFRPKFELIQAFMPVLIICKFDKYPIKGDWEKMETSFFSQLKGTLLKNDWSDMSEIRIDTRFYACPRYL